MSSYSEKLLDPRWQKKRLQIFERDNFTCQKCFNTKETLHVHHLAYIKDTEPWDYPDDYLLTVCMLCHSDTVDQIQSLQSFVFRLYRHSLGLNTDITVTFDKLLSTHKDSYLYGAINDIIHYAIENPRLVRKVANLFVWGRIAKSFKGKSVDKWLTFNGVFSKVLKTEKIPK